MLSVVQRIKSKGFKNELFRRNNYSKKILLEYLLGSSYLTTFKNSSLIL